jgi:hypothetical protein
MALTGWLAVGTVGMNLIVLLPTALWLGGINVPVTRFTRQFHPDLEANFFTWYSSFLLTSAALIAVANFWLESATAIRQHWTRYLWLGICGTFLALSVEEVAMVHESVGVAFTTEFTGMGSWADYASAYGRSWIIPYSPAILAVAGFLFYGFQTFFRGHRRLLVLSLVGLALWIASLFLEFVQFDIRAAKGAWLVTLEILVEEGFELFGTTCMLLAFVSHAQTKVQAALSSVPRAIA